MSVKKMSILSANNADPYDLYRKSVQDVEAEIDFVAAEYQRLNDRPAYSLREDFCGTASTAAEWVRRGEQHYAWALDCDPAPLEWGRRRHQKELPKKAQARLQLLQEDVLKTTLPPVDIILAMNFSYWLFQERLQMLAYFQRVRRGLRDKGVFFLDCYGGYDAPREILEERECDGFTYEWEQAEFNPITSLMQCYIHFSFEDGSRLDRAFDYRWRLWTLPEIRELLLEAGFAKVTVYWQGWDEDGEADGDFQPKETADADAGWICYLAAQVP